MHYYTVGVLQLASGAGDKYQYSGALETVIT